MAFHESHERFCPGCQARLSATAPKCSNCGRRVGQDAPDDQPNESSSATVRRTVLSFALALAVVGLLVVFTRERTPVEPVVQQFEKARRESGQPGLHARSPITRAEVEPGLRAGMAFDEVRRLVSAKNNGPNQSTAMMALPAGDAPPPAADDEDAPPGPLMHVIFLNDARLRVRTDAAGKVESWAFEPAK